MNKKMSIVALSAAFIGMGIAMPQCPGDKAMQDQVDTLKATQTTMTQKLQKLDTDAKQANTSAETIKQELTQLAGAIEAQNGAIKRLDDAIKDIQTKMAAAAAAPKPKGKKKGH